MRQQLCARARLAATGLGALGVLLLVPALSAAQPQAAPVSWNGTWTETVSGDPNGHIYLTQAPGSSTVTGTYTFCDGKVTGTTARRVRRDVDADVALRQCTGR